MDEPADRVIIKILLSFPDGLKRAELRRKCEKKFAKRTFDRGLVRLTKQGTIEKIKDLNKGKNSTTVYKLSLNPKTAELCKNIISLFVDFKKFMENKELSNLKVLTGCSYIIQMYGVIYQMSARLFLFKGERGDLIYDVLLDALKERLGEFRVLFFKRFKTKRNIDQFLEESRILTLHDFIQTLFKLRRSMIITMKPRTVEEILLDHRPIENPFEAADFSSNLKTTRLEEKWEQELEGAFSKMDRRMKEKSEEVEKIVILKRVLLQFNSKADMENTEAIDMHTKSSKVVDAMITETLARFDANIDLAQLAFSYEAEKNKFLGK